MQTLCPTEHSGQCLQRNTHDIVFGLLCGECGASGLRVETQLPTGWLLRFETFAHDPCPHTTRGAELGDFFEQVVVCVEEERKLPREIVHLQASFQSRFHISNSICQGECHFLNRGRTSSTDV